MVKKILIIGPSWLGDMIMAQVLFKLLKQQSECEIDVLAPNWSLPILACMPEVTQAIEMPIAHGQLKLWVRYKLGKLLRNKNYQQAIVLPNSWKSALIPVWAKIPQRTGWLGEQRWKILNDIHRLDPKALPLMIQRYAALALPKVNNFDLNNLANNQELLPKLTVSLDLINNTKQQFNLPLFFNKPILALCPGAAFGSAKRWPENYYLEVALDRIQQGWEIWLFGAKPDLTVTKNIQQGIEDLTEDSSCYKNFSGQLELPQTVALLSLATAVISNDSGLMHVAASLNKPLIGIFGATNPNYTPPLGQNSHILYKNLACSPCMQRECPLGHHQCMHDISPGEVLELLQKCTF